MSNYTKQLEKTLAKYAMQVQDLESRLQMFRDNINFMLNDDPDVILVKGPGDENLIQSLVLTMARTSHMRDLYKDRRIPHNGS